MKNALLFCLFGSAILLLTCCTENQDSSHDPVSGMTFTETMDSLKALDLLIIKEKAVEPEKAFSYAHAAYRIALSTGSDSLLAFSHFLKGVAYRNFHDDSAYFYNTLGLKLAAKSGYTSLIPTLLYNQAQVYHTAFDSHSEIIFLDSCIRLARINKDYEALSNAFNALGNIKYEAHDTSDSRRLYDSAYQIARLHGLYRQIGVSLASLSRLESNPETSSAMLRTALANLSKKPGYEEEIAMILVNIGTDASHPDTALYYLQKGIDYARKSNSQKLLMTAYNNMAYSYLDKNMLQEAESCLRDNAIPIALKIKHNDWLSTLYDSYMDVKIAGGATEQALQYEQKALKTRIIANQQQASEQVRLLSALLESRDKELMIEKSQSEIQHQRNRNQWIIGWFSAGILLSGLIVLLVLWRMQRKHLADQAQMLLSAKKLIESEETHKGRIAIELHDMITPFYHGMMQKIETSGIQNPGLKSDFKNTVSGMSSALRDISHRMNSDFCNQFDINELMTGLCEDFRKTTALQINCSIGEEDYHLSGEEKIHLYRIIQELLTNARKYVKSGTVNLSLSYASGIILLLYRDNGTGFDATAMERKGLGLVSIQERARLVKGTAILHTAPGKGTTWSISIPHPQVKHTHSTQES